jgi:hypothetical protein
MDRKKWTRLASEAAVEAENRATCSPVLDLLERVERETAERCVEIGWNQSGGAFAYIMAEIREEFGLETFK